MKIFSPKNKLSISTLRKPNLFVDSKKDEQSLGRDNALGDYLKDTREKLTPDFIEEGVSDYFKPSKEGTRIRDVAREIPGSFKDIFFPERYSPETGEKFTEEKMREADPTFVQSIEAFPKLGAEILGGTIMLEDLLADVPGVQSVAETKVGGKLAGVGGVIKKGAKKLFEYSQPETKEEASAMRLADVAFILPVGELRIGTGAANTIAKTKNTSKIAKTLKNEISDLTDDGAEAMSQILKDVSDPDDVQTALNRIDYAKNAHKNNLGVSYASQQESIIENPFFKVAEPTKTKLKQPSTKKIEDKGIFDSFVGRYPGGVSGAGRIEQINNAELVPVEFDELFHATSKKSFDSIKKEGVINKSEGGIFGDGVYLSDVKMRPFGTDFVKVNTKGMDFIEVDLGGGQEGFGHPRTKNSLGFGELILKIFGEDSREWNSFKEIHSHPGNAYDQSGGIGLATVVDFMDKPENRNIFSDFINNSEFDGISFKFPVDIHDTSGDTLREIYIPKDVPISGKSQPEQINKNNLLIKLGLGSAGATAGLSGIKKGLTSEPIEYEREEKPKPKVKSRRKTLYGDIVTLEDDLVVREPTKKLREAIDNTNRNNPDIPDGLIEAIIMQESSMNSNQSQKNEDIGESAYLTGFTNIAKKDLIRKGISPDLDTFEGVLQATADYIRMRMTKYNEDGSVLMKYKNLPKFYKERYYTKDELDEEDLERFGKYIEYYASR